MHNLLALQEHFKTILDKIDEAGFHHFFETRESIDFYEAAQETDAIDNIYFDCGSTRAVFWESDFPYVIKIPFFSEKNRDYCKVEVENYKAAELFLVEDCFAWCEFLFTYHDCPIYVMEKAICDEENISDCAYSASLKWALSEEGISEEENPEEYGFFCENFSSNYFNWESDSQMDSYIEEEWGFEKARAFNDFCFEVGINDRHTGNWGHIDGRLVMVDYSGYYGI